MLRWRRLLLLLLLVLSKRVVRVWRRWRGAMAGFGQGLLQTGLLDDPVTLGQEVLLLWLVERRLVLKLAGELLIGLLLELARRVEALGALGSLRAVWALR